jgi:hypothetical protein
MQNLIKILLAASEECAAYPSEEELQLRKEVELEDKKRMVLKVKNKIQK